MATAAYPGVLQQIADDTYAYLQLPGSWGWSNSGLITTGHQALLIDTLFTLDLTQHLLDTIAATRPDVQITTVVNTHANGDHCWGNQLLPHAQIVSSLPMAEGMHEEIEPAAMTRMLQQNPPDSPLGAYMRQFFACHDFAGITLTPPTRTFRGQLTLHLGPRTIQLVEVGPAHTSGDVIVHVPDAGVVFAGDILFVGDHPVMWSGPIGNWIRACDLILATGADVIVPGHGPVTDPAGVREIRHYLTYVQQQAELFLRRGVPYHVAALEIDMSRYSSWGHPERLVVTIGNIYRNLGQDEPGGRPTMIRHMAEAYAHLHQHPSPTVAAAG